MATKKASMDRPKPKPTPVEKQQLAALSAVDEVLAPKKRGAQHPRKQLHPHHPAMPYLVGALVVSLGVLAFAVLQSPPAQKFAPPKGNMAAEAQAAVDTLEQSAGQLETSSIDDATLSESSFTQ